jgi:glycosyltransferase involved in cell wall biosynthesis
MMFSFIIPAHNEEKLLPRTLTSIHKSAKAINLDYEIIVADDASTDATPEIAKQHGAELVRVDHRQISKTRNSGAAAATGDVFVFVDADTMINSTLLESLRTNIINGAVGGGTRVRFDGKLPLYGKLLLHPLEFLYQRVAGYAYGCFVFCTRAAFESVGGFDKTLFAGEEIAISVALRRQGNFILLRQPVITSGRKLRTYSFWECLKMLLSFILGGGQRTLKNRDRLDLWYGPRREDKCK